MPSEPSETDSFLEGLNAFATNAFLANNESTKPQTQFVLGKEDFRRPNQSPQIVKITATFCEYNSAVGSGILINDVKHKVVRIKDNYVQWVLTVNLHSL